MCALGAAAATETGTWARGNAPETGFGPGRLVMLARTPCRLTETPGGAPRTDAERAGTLMTAVARVGALQMRQTHAFSPARESTLALLR